VIHENNLNVSSTDSILRKMEANEKAIKVYCRVKTNEENEIDTVHYDVKPDDDNNKKHVTFTVPSSFKKSQHQFQSSAFDFIFNDVLDERVSQQRVYDVVARNVVDDVLQGINGTVFAYGQTATGKTYTIIGDDDFLSWDKVFALTPVPNGNGNGIDNHEEEEIAITGKTGIVARALAHIFMQYTEGMKVHVSFLEIYKEVGYDLLSLSKHSGKADIRLETIDNIRDLQHVVGMTDGKKRFHLRNLSKHEVKNEKEALRLLSLGNENRHIAETHLNNASSRSHGVFTIQITNRSPGSDLTFRSKLNLVDLAGSERVGKSHNKDRVLLNEARNINLSLHHLQRVIVALSMKRRADDKTVKNGKKTYHVPFRNSMITMVLGDSLGGNSNTAMVATVSAERKHFEETVSTCRFAQRVSLIRNTAEVNETMDADVVIARLKKELNDIKNSQGGGSNGSYSSISKPLTSSDERALLQLMNRYLSNNSQPYLDVGPEYERVQFCFQKMRELVSKRNNNVTASQVTVVTHCHPPKLTIISMCPSNNPLRRLLMMVRTNRKPAL